MEETKQSKQNNDQYKARRDKYEGEKEQEEGMSRGEVHLEVASHFLQRSRGGDRCLGAGDRWSRLYDDVEVGSRGKVFKAQKVGQRLEHSDGGQ